MHVCFHSSKLCNSLGIIIFLTEMIFPITTFGCNIPLSTQVDSAMHSLQQTRDLNKSGSLYEQVDEVPIWFMHRYPQLEIWAWELLHKIWKYIRIFMGKPIISVNLRKWKDFNKKQLTLLKMCVTFLLCKVSCFSLIESGAFHFFIFMLQKPWGEGYFRF